MLFGTYKALGIVTHSGEAWILTQNSSIFGDNGDDDMYNKKVFGTEYIKVAPLMEVH